MSARPDASRRAALLGLLSMAGCAARGGATAPPRPSQAPAFDLQAHRGGRGLAPENTLAAFAQAMALGVSTLELDVVLSADDQVVISHDAALNPAHTRTADGRFLDAPGPWIRSLTLEALQRYDVGRIAPGSAYARQFPDQVPRDGERLPTLDALFALARTRGADAVRFNIETKLDPTGATRTASPEHTVRVLLDRIDAAGLRSRCTIQSFDWRALALVARWAPDLPRAYLSSPRTLADPRWTLGLRLADFASVPRLVRAADAGPALWSPHYESIAPAAIDEAHALGLRVLPWTVNRVADMARWIERGADGLITDRPDLLRALMAERGMALPPAYPPRGHAPG